MGFPLSTLYLRVFATIEPEKFMQMSYPWIRDVLSTIQKNKKLEPQ